MKLVSLTCWVLQYTICSIVNKYYMFVFACSQRNCLCMLWFYCHTIIYEKLFIYCLDVSSV